MKTLGIIGGIGPESTIAYYRAFIAAYRARVGDGTYPSVLINSIDMTRMLDLIAAGRLEDVTEFLLRELDRLAKGGADFALLSSNTPHLVFDALSARAPLPLLSIVEAARDAARGYARVGLFGTAFTMNAPFYPETFQAADIAVHTPTADEKAEIHRIYMGELVNGIFRDEARQRLLAILERMVVQDDIQALVLGGTELPLILTEDSHQGIPFLDTTRIHVARALDRVLGQSC
ncbi:MAG TPA: amino acid racemase [Holophaga sp.]|nr:amino acid racemase [Holophaga sp.]